jgi:YjbE family integral membrane protein
MIEFFQNLNWIIVGQIILIDILLGGDNAIVIALACRHLPEKTRFKGILWGTVGAIAIRIVLIAFAVTLLDLPFLKIIGGLLLLWIGAKLLVEEDEAHDHISGSDRLISAIKTIIIADLVMSVDNVIAVASAAEQANDEHKLILVVFGILISIPIVVWGSSIVLKLMDRVPAIVTLGAGLLGYLGGSMIVTDVAIHKEMVEHLPYMHLSLEQVSLHLSLPGCLGAFGVIIVGWWVNRQREKEQSASDDHDHSTHA